MFACMSVHVCTTPCVCVSQMSLMEAGRDRGGGHGVGCGNGMDGVERWNWH